MSGIVVWFPFVLALGCLGIGLLLWSYKKGPRFVAAFIGAAGFGFTIAIPPWRDALASVTQSGPALVILLFLTVGSGICFWFEAVRKHKHHRIRTPVVSATFGTVLVLAIANTDLMLSSLGKSFAKTGTTLHHTVAQVHSGAAARGVQPDHRMFILGVGLAILIMIVVVGIRMDKRKPGGGRGMLPPGPSGARPAARAALAAPRGRAGR